MNRKFKTLMNRENILAFLLMLIITFFFLLNSPLHPWIGGVTGTDSSVFKTVAMMMEKGYIPYKDSFDHKGPLLYILQYLGDKISTYQGIWVIEYVFMLINFFVMYKVARLRCCICSSIITFFTAISLLFRYFEGGNLVEEYAMPMITISLYIFLDYLINDRISNFRITVCGLTCGVVVLLRANMISLWVVFCLWIFVILLRDKKWKVLRCYTLHFIMGLLTVLLPVIAWLASKKALVDCFECYIIFNKYYTLSEGGLVSFGAVWNSFFSFSNTQVYIAAFGIMLYEVKRKERNISIPYLIYMICTLLFMCISGRIYGHYGMILIPVFVYPISLIFHKIEKIKMKELESVGLMIIGVYLLSSIIMPDWLNHLSTAAYTYANRENDNMDETVSTICHFIEQYTGDEESISVYGNKDCIYVLSRRRHATKYSYQVTIGPVMPEIMNEYFAELEVEQPRMIIIQNGFFDDRINDFLTDNHYEFINVAEDLKGDLLYVKK